MLKYIMLILFIITTASFVYRHDNKQKVILDPEMEELLEKNGYKKGRD